MSRGSDEGSRVRVVPPLSCSGPNSGGAWIGAGRRVRGRALRAACGLDALSTERAIVLAEREGLSGRGTERLLRVARTIADLDGSMAVESGHLEEAAWYRSPLLKHAALAS